MEPSKYQKDIIDFFKSHPHDNIFVNALAGTGKSTILKMLSDITSSSDIYVAFNSSIAEEFRTKITNPKTKVMTLHSLGLSIMNYNLKEKSSEPIGFGKRNSLPGNSGTDKAVLDNLKIYKIIDRIIEERMSGVEFAEKSFIRENYHSLYNLIRLTRSDMMDYNAIEKLIKEYYLFMDYSGNDFECPRYSTISSWINEINRVSLEEFEDFNFIDYTDMLYITHKKIASKEWEIPYWNLYTNIYVDEAQDLNNLQIELIKFIKRNGGRYIFVSDENQAIYMFSGANSKSYSLIKKVYAPVKEFDLPINYRCPTSHLDMVNDHYGIPILPRPEAPSGAILTIEKNEICKYVKPGDMIISRKNKWLSTVVMDLAKHKIPIYIQDKELVGQLKNIIDKQKALSLKVLDTKLKAVVRKYTEAIRESEERSIDNPEGKSLTDRAEEIASTNSKIDNIEFIISLLKNFSTENPKSTVSEFKTYIDTLLNTSSSVDSVRVCSVHKAKGLEAPNVFVLNEAKPCKDGRNSPEQNRQEINLSYISITRAMSNLFLVKEKETKEREY